MLVSKASHGCVCGVFHLSTEHLCQRLSFSVETTENRMRVARKPLAHTVWEVTLLRAQLCGVRGLPLPNPALPHVLLTSQSSCKPEVLCGHLCLLCRQNSSSGGNSLPTSVSIPLIPRTSYQKNMNRHECSPQRTPVWAQPWDVSWL